MATQSKSGKSYSDVIRTPPLVIGWPALAQPNTSKNFPESPAKYKVVGFIDKNDEEGLDNLFSAILDAAGETKLSSLVMHPFRGESRVLNDGDLDEFVMKPAHAGCYFFYTSSQTKPQIFIRSDDGNVISISDDQEAIKEHFYSGCRCSLVLKAMMYRPKKVSFILLGIMKEEDGEKFGGLSSIDIQNIFLSNNNWAKIKEEEKDIPEPEEELPPAPPPPPADTAPAPRKIEVSTQKEVSVRKKANLSSLL